MENPWLTDEGMPVSRVWLGGSNEAPFQRHFWFCLLADGPDPRQEERRRWDVICYNHYLDKRIWRVQKIELSTDGLRVHSLVDGGRIVRCRLFPLTTEWVKGPGLGALPSCIAPHWVIGKPVEGLNRSMNFHLSDVIKRKDKEIEFRDTHPFKPTEPMIEALTLQYREILSEPFSLEALRAEPSGYLPVIQPWTVQYELRIRDGKTLLRLKMENRFTNDSESEIDENGSRLSTIN